MGSTASPSTGRGIAADTSAQRPCGCPSSTLHMPRPLDGPTPCDGGPHSIGPGIDKTARHPPNRQHTPTIARPTYNSLSRRRDQEASLSDTRAPVGAARGHWPDLTPAEAQRLNHHLRTKYIEGAA